MKRFWMRSLTGQWIALTLVALAVSQILFYYIYRAEQARTVLELRRDEFLARAAAVARLMNTVEPGLHPEILRATNTGVVRFWLTDEGPVRIVDWQAAASEKLLESPRPPEASVLGIQPRARWEKPTGENRFGEPAAKMMHLRDWNGFGLVVPVKDGLWLNAVYAKPGTVTGPPWYYYLSLAITAVLLSLVSVLLVRKLARPLRRLTDSAERLGRGEEVPPLPEEGADDVRRMTVAFNRMQSRLRRFTSRQAFWSRSFIGRRTMSPSLSSTGQYGVFSSHPRSRRPCGGGPRRAAGPPRASAAAPGRRGRPSPRRWSRAG